MTDFSNITIVNVDGRVRDLSAAQMALVLSGRFMPGARLLLLSPERPARLLAGITHCQIGTLDYFQYNLFVVYALSAFIETDFALIVQDDGWVIDGEGWDERFLRYDYLGAPIHLAQVTAQGTMTFLSGFEWVALLHDAARQIVPVLNGGFSLRSKRLLEAPARLGLPYQVPPPSRLVGPPHVMQWEANTHLEDVQICVFMGQKLMEAGIAIAPVAEAAKFAVEHCAPGLQNAANLQVLFGHHSTLRKLTSLDPLTVTYPVSKQTVEGLFGEVSIAAMFASRGYIVKYAM